MGYWRGYLSGARCRLAYGPADATATLASVKSRLVLPFWYQPTRVVPEKGPLNVCVCTSIHIIAVQEHWLHDGNSHVLNNVHPDFVGFCISSMSDRLHTSVYRGRPYGGVGFLVRKALSHKFKICTKAVSGRCLSATISLDSGEDVNINRIYVFTFL